MNNRSDEEIIADPVPLPVPKKNFPEVGPHAEPPHVLELLLLPYLLKLRSQSNSKKLTYKQRWAFGKHYKQNMDLVSYYENVNTGHGAAITIGTEIFFPRSLNLNSIGDVWWMLHELEHVDQYKRAGSIENFLRGYFGDAVLTMIKNFTFNPHDNMQTEKDADKKANDVLGMVMTDLAKKTEFSLKVATSLHATDKNYKFLLDKDNNLFVVKKNNTGKNKTEVHILSAASNYKSFLLQTTTCLHETDDSFDFLLDKNSNLFAIKKSGTGARMTEVHVLSASSKYQKFSLQTGTMFEETDHNFSFMLDKDNNLFVIKKNNTGTNMTEVHILSAASNYQRFLMQRVTCLEMTYDNFEFLLDNSNNIFAIKKNRTGTNSTEVHVLSAASDYQKFMLQTTTCLHETHDDFQFILSRDRHLYAIKKSGTPNNLTEVHVIQMDYEEIFQLNANDSRKYSILGAGFFDSRRGMQHPTITSIIDPLPPNHYPCKL